MMEVVVTTEATRRPKFRQHTILGNVLITEAVTDQQIVPTSTAMSMTSEQTWNCSESSGAESAAIASFVNTSNK